MTIPGVGHLTALAFTAAVDDPGRFRPSRDLGAYLALMPRRYQSGEVDYTGSISKCGDRADANPALRSCERHADALQGTAEVERLGVGHCQAVHPVKGADRARPAARHHHARHASARHGVQTDVADQRR